MSGDGSQLVTVTSVDRYEQIDNSRAGLSTGGSGFLGMDLQVQENV